MFESRLSRRRQRWLEIMKKSCSMHRPENLSFKGISILFHMVSMDTNTPKKKINSFEFVFFSFAYQKDEFLESLHSRQREKPLSLFIFIFPKNLVFPFSFRFKLAHRKNFLSSAAVHTTNIMSCFAIDPGCHGTLMAFYLVVGVIIAFTTFHGN